MRARRLLLAAVAGWSASLPLPAGAQAPRPFDRVDVGVYGAVGIDRSPFHDYWDTRPAAAVDFVTPFYLGRASLLFRVGGHEAVAGASVPGFVSVFGALGWRVGRALAGDLRADAGLHVGVTEWVFDSDEQWQARYELELGSEASVRAAYEVVSRWHAVVEGSYQFTFTRRRIELAYVSVGLARSFTAPGWVRSVLE